VQQLEADIAMRHGSDEYPLWRLQLDELQKDLQGATQRVLASLSISDMAPPPRPGAVWVALKLDHELDLLWL
jgi:hypothetical protein